MAISSSSNRPRCRRGRRRRGDERVLALIVGRQRPVGRIEQAGEARLADELEVRRQPARRRALEQLDKPERRRKDRRGKGSEVAGGRKGGQRDRHALDVELEALVGDDDRQLERLLQVASRARARVTSAVEFFDPN
jgi:hypothetical protein